MKRTKLLPYLLLSNSVGVLVATSALAEVTPITQSPITERSRLSEIEFPLTTAKGRVQQPESGKSAIQTCKEPAIAALCWRTNQVL